MRALLLITVIGGILVLGCQRQDAAAPPDPTQTAAAVAPKHASNLPPLHPTNIVSLALASEDHTTLVAALEAADYVTSVAASGPLTVFAPTNEAFAQLPEGTVEELLKPENADQLREILKYHVTTSALAADSFKDDQKIGMANGEKTTIHLQDDKILINQATIVTSIPASNGMLHVVDAVLLPPEEK
jgi:uncharacterized surface protein with fasciclin (FAS1) repeats